MTWFRWCGMGGNPVPGFWVNVCYRDCAIETVKVSECLGWKPHNGSKYDIVGFQVITNRLIDKSAIPV